MCENKRVNQLARTLSLLVQSIYHVALSPGVNRAGRCLENSQQASGCIDRQHNALRFPILHTRNGA